MSSAARAAELRELADHFDAIGTLEEAAAQAKATYRDEPGDGDLKAAHNAAAAALRDARAEARSSGLLVAAAEPGSVTIAPQVVRGKGSVG